MASFDEVVPPGQAGTIRASIHTSNYKGPIGKTITVTHDDASQGPITLAVKANVIGSVNVYPYASLTLSQRLKGWTKPGLLLVRKDETENGSLAVEGLTASVPWLKVTSRKVTTDEPAVEGLPAGLAGVGDARVREAVNLAFDREAAVKGAKAKSDAAAVHGD